MGKRTQLNLEEMLGVMRHLADVASLRTDPMAQRQLLIDGLNAMVGTDSAFFYVADEWRPEKRPHFSSFTLSTQRDPLFLRYTAEFGIKFPLDDDPYSFQSIRSAAALQAWTSRDVVPDAAAEQRHVNFMDLRATGRLRDGVVTFYRTGDGGDRIVGVGMHRFGAGSRCLSPREVALATFAVREIERLVSRGYLLLAICPTALPPRLQETFDRLLAGQAPKEMARELGLSLWTVREHIQRLYRHFGVSGREELTALFIAGRAVPSRARSPCG